jgi:hypothetical protein
MEKVFPAALPDPVRVTSALPPASAEFAAAATAAPTTTLRALRARRRDPARLPLPVESTAAPAPFAPAPRAREARNRRSTPSESGGEPGARPSTRCHPSGARYPVATDRGTTHSKHARDRHSPSRVVVGSPSIDPSDVPPLGPKGLKWRGQKAHFLRGGNRRECLSRFKKFWVTGPLAVGSWSYRLRHTLRLSRSGGRSLKDPFPIPENLKHRRENFFSPS